MPDDLTVQPTPATPAASEGASATADTSASPSTDVTPTDPDDKRDSWVSDDVRKAMDFDPFLSSEEEKEAQPTTPDGSPSTAGGANAPQPVSVTPAQVPASGSPQATAPLTPEQIVALQQEVSRLQNLVQTAPAAQAPQQQPQGQPAASTAENDPFKTVPDYGFNIPDQLVDMLGSEDPVQRKQALGYTMQGLAKAVHQTVLSVVAERFQHVETNLPKTVFERLELARQEQQVGSDFYGAYPNLNKPELRPLVRQVGEAVLRETKATTWNAQLRDLIAQRVLASLQGVVQPATPAKPAAPAAQPVMFGGSSSSGNARAEGPKGPKTQQDHMADIFDF